MLKLLQVLLLACVIVLLYVSVVASDTKKAECEITGCKQK